MIIARSSGASLHARAALTPTTPWTRAALTVARDFGAAGVSTAPAVSSISVSWERGQYRSPHLISQRTVAAPYIYPVNHVVGALAIHCAASLLRHPHRFLSLYRIYFRRLCVQET